MTFLANHLVSKNFWGVIVGYGQVYINLTTSALPRPVSVAGSFECGRFAVKIHGASLQVWRWNAGSVRVPGMDIGEDSRHEYTYYPLDFFSKIEQWKKKSGGLFVYRDSNS